MLKPKDIIKSATTGRYQVIRKVWESSLPGHFWVVAYKVRKTDGIAWGDDAVHLLPPGRDLPWRHVLVSDGAEPETLKVWRGE